MLKSLDISGFKSFARPTHLEFPPGITAIVGPNGSGKSNVVDAIRWCLGEQSSRELRGTRSEDVIYAGRRRTLGAADVALLLGDANGADIEIGRRLYRSGESEYLVNRRRVRLRDVVIALAGAGIDAGRHVVVNQGMADALLSAGPYERRGLLEQAAGLSRYREQRDEARQKIATTRSSIETIQVVLGEMEPRLVLLRRQAKAVVDRKEVAGRLTESLRLWHAHRWRNALDAVRVARAELTLAHEELETARTDLSAMEARIDELLVGERSAVQQRESAIATLHQTERECDELRRNRDALQERIADTTERVREARAMRERVEESVVHSQAELAEAEQALSAIERELGELGEHCDCTRLAVTRAREAFSRASDTAREARATLTRDVDRHGAAVDAFHTAKRTLETCVADRARLTEQFTALHARQGVLESEVVEVTGRLDARRRHVHAAERRVSSLQHDRNHCLTRLRRITRIQRRLEAKLGAASGAVEAARRRQRAAADGVNTDLLERLRVPTGWEKAIAAALGERARAGSVDVADPDLAEFRLWREALGLAGIWADDIVSGVPPLLAGTLLVESDDRARATWAGICDRPAHLIGSPSLRIVARSGLVCEAAGARLSDRDPGASDYLRDRAEAERWERRSSEVERRISRLTTQEQSSSERLASIENGLGDAERSLRAGREALSETSGMKSALDRQVAAAVEEERYVRAAVQQAEADLVARAERASMAEQAACSSAEEVTKARAFCDQAGHAADDASRHLERAQADHNVDCQAIAIAEERRAHRQTARDAACDTLSRLQTELERAITGIPAFETQIERARSERDQLGRALRAAGDRLDGQRKRLEALPTPLNFQRPDPQGLRDTLIEATSRFERASVRVDQAEDEVLRLRAEIQLDLGIGPEQLPPANRDAPTDAEIRRLRNRVAGLAEIDDAVVGEYEELNERYSYLRHHLDDLDRAMGELNEILAVSDREMETRFATAFGAVDAEFGRVYAIMLRGGTGRLAQSAGGGVDIIAELPGKRSRSATAYSGGERALLATALLFAVLKIRPTPFCVLDEVDAALDESNVDRYLAVLKDVSESTQTIVVTHNRATMAAADVLYGMTMDGEGGTNVLSLNLQTYSAS